MATAEMALSIKVSWWVRPILKLVYRWCAFTGREPDYKTLAKFAVKYGMKIKVTKHAA